jgi:hypothetical protein
MIRLAGPNDRIGIVFYFKKEVTNDQINYFLNYELGRPRPDGRGSDLAKGLKGDFLVRAQGYEGYALELSPEITDEERQNILIKLQQSPLVFKVFENVVPAEIVLDPSAAKKEKEVLEKAKGDNRPVEQVITNANKEGK